MHSDACPLCGEPLFDGELFCPSCGGLVESSVAVATPPSPVTGPQASPRTRAGETPSPCQGCGRELALVELFCPRCGAPRPGSDLAPRRGRRLGGEAAWKQLTERLKEVTRGRYEIERELGRGGMAAVFLAHEVALHRRVAIKVMRPAFLLDQALVERFLREARTMASFHHPNIVTVHAVEAIEELHFFVMQYIAGQSLAQILREFGPLPVAAVQSVIYQAAAGLSHAHRSGVIHRDVKPANIMMDTEGNAIVTDFGIAKLVDLNTSATAGPMGTPLYMSPEQCSGTETLTPASDQYALGTVAYELLAGKPPFEGESSVAVGLAIVKQPPPPLRSFRLDCPPEIEAAVLRMLEKKPADRFPTLNDAIAAVGGEALTDDDPVRGFLAALARHDTPAHGPEMLTPRRSRTSPPVRLHPEDVTRRAARRKLLAGLGVFATAAVFTVLAILAAMKARAGRGVRTDSAVAAAPAPDSSATSPGLGGDVAVAGEAPDTATRPPVARRPRAVPPPPPPSTKVTNPAVAVRDTGSAGPAQALTPAPVPPPPPPPVVRVDTVRVAPSPPPPPPPPPSREPAIRRVITEYGDAVNSRSLARMKALYPAMPPSRQKVWSDLFRDDVKDLKAAVTITNVTERGDLADALFTMDLSFRPERGDQYRSQIKMEATLRLENGAWKFLTLTP